MNDPRSGGGNSSNELRIVVWQFVRIMVQLETVARARGQAKAPTVYGDWRPAWTEVDRTLTRLGESDAEAFSDLMMNQEVVLRTRDRSQMNEVTRAIENVVNQLDQEIRAVRGEATAEVTSAEKLTGAQVKALKEALKESVGKDVKLDASVDPSLIGGMIVKVGSRMIDTSLKTKLNSLRIAMKEVG